MQRKVAQVVWAIAGLHRLVGKLSLQFALAEYDASQ